MQTQKAVGLLVGILLIVALLFVVSMESQRRQRRHAMTEANKVERTSAGASAASPAGPPSFFPTGSEQLVILPGKVEVTKHSFRGPMSVRVLVAAPKAIWLTMVPRSEAQTYRTQEQVARTMESARCANSGQGSVSLTCELKETEENMVVVIADTRDSTQGARDIFDAKKLSNEAAPNTVIVDMFTALALKQ